MSSTGNCLERYSRGFNVAYALTPSTHWRYVYGKAESIQYGLSIARHLRQQVEERLHDHRATLEKQLALLGGSIASRGPSKVARGGRGSTLKGKKVAPKYRGPSGETWAGRGATPR